MHPFLNKMAQLAGMDPEEPKKSPSAQKAQEQAWLHGWYVKAKNNRPQRSTTTHVKRRTRR